jgi:predicted lipid-binding transport protein (Tim44 family)
VADTGTLIRPSATPARTASKPQARGRAAAAFISGLTGLLVANLLLGPLAIGLGISALRRRESSRGRAVLAIVLGVADIAVFAVLATHAVLGHHGPIWRFGSF